MADPEQPSTSQQTTINPPMNAQRSSKNRKAHLVAADLEDEEDSVLEADVRNYYQNCMMNLGIYSRAQAIYSVTLMTLNWVNCMVMDPQAMYWQKGIVRKEELHTIS